MLFPGELNFNKAHGMTMYFVYNQSGVTTLAWTVNKNLRKSTDHEPGTCGIVVWINEIYFSFIYTLLKISSFQTKF